MSSIPETLGPFPTQDTRWQRLFTVVVNERDERARAPSLVTLFQAAKAAGFTEDQVLEAIDNVGRGREEASRQLTDPNHFRRRVPITTPPPAPEPAPPTHAVVAEADAAAPETIAIDHVAQPIVVQAGAVSRGIGRALAGARAMRGKRRDVADIATGEVARPAGVISPTDQEPLPLTDFFAFMPKHQYINASTKQLWPAVSVNACVTWLGKAKPSDILDATRAVHQMSWLPGKPQIVRDLVIVEGGLIEKKGSSIFNLYTAPPEVDGNPDDVEPYLEHARALYPEGFDHILDWFAFRAQHPEEKINHALVLGGRFGIGKDTLLAPAKRAVGDCNCQDVSPLVVLGRFNGFLKSIILVISEARDLGPFDRYAFFDHTKSIIAAPPEVLRIDDKGLPEYYVPNVLGVIVTTNHLENGIYLPRGDRRHYVAWSEVPEDDPASQARCQRLWDWLKNQGGFDNVVAYLRTRDVSRFNPKAPPPKTPAFWSIVQANTPHDENEIADLLDAMGNPDAVTLRLLAEAATNRSLPELAEGLRDKRRSRVNSGYLRAAGYTMVRNSTSPKDGMWQVDGKRSVIYAKSELSIHAQHIVAQALCDDSRR